ncbi:hypothetical protein H6G80_08440 [Nostoc sp. FACHB-87]|uniref:hypothetical protein n=1 Tax=Nostocales TaxID=1161 RepID=UPI001688082D|nr:MULTISPECIES: hypothetical protein [Nostocales]MBD2298007.1 hypothetical protein [Nostoc sp. FACHB-190]MBD2454106.1 hypothetical protein [Nostoc sp. FACHB-87]MBD2476199.1 hypothetical protein [Anabaena sp. FACHB-83]MBD2491910.1 hypothetical protein [Aulosira sp. FACHB-615]
MARAIERIERDLAMLEEAIRAIAAELQSAYTVYLTLLGEAVRKQLILASYHLCTQGYPENFLKLSLNQRQKLQQAIRQLGKQLSEELITYMNGEIVTEEENEGNETEEEAVTENPKLNPPDSSNPVEIAKWQNHLEELTQQALKKVSHDTNVLLQQADILPKKVPEPILEAAAAASEAAAEVMPGPPNLLNLVIEIDNEQDEEESSLTQIMTINLRLGEIEFADATLASSRKQIRNILVQLQKLGREYQKKQRERSIAEAEAAWRSSWYED